jgi:hypothetical protein
MTTQNNWMRSAQPHLEQASQRALLLLLADCCASIALA